MKLLLSCRVPDLYSKPLHYRSLGCLAKSRKGGGWPKGTTSKAHTPSPPTDFHPWPMADGHTCSTSTPNCRVQKSMPIVARVLLANSSLMKRCMTQDFPTPESPTRTTCQVAAKTFASPPSMPSLALLSSPTISQATQGAAKDCPPATMGGGAPHI